MLKWTPGSGKVFLRSDDHFEHRNICRYADRPWANWDKEDVEADERALKEMGEAFVTFHNESVKPGDLVIFGGDVVMGDWRWALQRWVADMHGRKLLIIGNHDVMFKRTYSAYDFNRYQQVFTEGILTWLDMQTVLPFSHRRMIVNHFPYEAGTGPRKVKGPDRYAGWRPVREPGQWLLHGHTHDHRVLTGDHQIHIGIDADYTPYGVKQYHPIPLDLIEAIIDENAIWIPARRRTT